MKIINDLILNLNNYNSRMFLHIIFFIYLLLLILYAIYTGLNHYRMQASGKVHPQVVTFLVPFMVNFLLAKFVFFRIEPLISTLFPCLMIFFLGKKIQKIRIFGLTGGIACGKSTLVNLMESNIGNELAIIDCDRINGELRHKGRAGYKIIMKLLKEDGENPEQYLNSYSQEIDRQKLSNYSFSHPQFLKKLGKKVGFYIFLEIFKQIVSHAFSSKKLILIDAPILYETKVLTHICFPIIVVGCSQSTQLKRLMEDRKMSEEDAKLRIQSQMPLSLKKKLSDVWIQNEGTTEDMFIRTLKALNKILEMNKK